jgi:hypothetical protein
MGGGHVNVPIHTGWGCPFAYELDQRLAVLLEQTSGCLHLGRIVMARDKCGSKSRRSGGGDRGLLRHDLGG